MPNYGAIIIGTGQSGPALARRLLAAARSRNPSESIPRFRPVALRAFPLLAVQVAAEVIEPITRGLNDVRAAS